MDKHKYWLKFYKDFLKSPQMKVIRKMPNGAEYILLYMALMLESIESVGHLRFSDSVPYNNDMLSSVTDTNIDIVRTGMKLFEELGMIQILPDKTIFLPDVPKLTGKECDSASRVRKYRLKQKENLEMLQCNVDVTKCNSDVTKCNDNIEEEKEKEIDSREDIDIDIDIEKDIDNSLLLLLEKNYARTITSLETDEVMRLQNKYPKELIIRAIEISVINNAKKLSYVNGILKNWESEGIKSLKDIRERNKDDPSIDIPEDVFNYDWLNNREGVD